jgi:alpha-glucosidase
MKGLLTTVLLTVLLAGNLVAQATAQTVKSDGLTVSPPTEVKLASPNGNVVVYFRLATIDGKIGCPVYRVDYQGKPALVVSRLGLETSDAPLMGNFKVACEKTSSHDSTWKPVCGERSEIRDHYNELAVTLQPGEGTGLTVEMTFRAYNEGVAFRYQFPKQPNADTLKITRERSEFRFLADHDTWAVYFAQGKYVPVKLSQTKSGLERPLPIRVSDNVYLALTEANNVDFARMKFAPLSGATNALVSALHGSVTAKLPFTTPWRVIMVANSPGQLLEQNYVIPNLNEPSQIADTSWIKPGKVIREVTLTTTGGKACIDFAVKRNLQYIMFDAGWYGDEYDKASDASGVNVDPKRSKGPLDLHEVIRYGNERGIGTILYVNQNALTPQLDTILPLYRQWGVKGVKYGFVHVGSQADTTWLHEAIRKAAANRLMVNIHDEFRSMGYDRTYPNLMTVEGIEGDECSPKNTNTLTILFSRMLTGPADNTACYYDSRVDRNASHAYQLAKSVCIFSPWQYLFWYDRPVGSPSKVGGAGGAETAIGDEPELEFWDALPTVWDDTKVIHGKISEYAVIARRHGNEWFIGAMNSTEPRTLEVPLSFLGAGKFTAHIYSDDPAINTRTKVRIDRTDVTAASTLKCIMTAQGGQAIRITPKLPLNSDTPVGRSVEPQALTKAQEEFPNWKFGLFLHFDIATFNNQEWANGRTLEEIERDLAK